jgi:light-regulated signal transduction histidine kinase (bacteriophytochrome)
MKPIKATINDTDALIELGRASVQVVHDLKNQINGLKLYATFLRKRMERGERPADELETINKIMAGLERAAGDMNLLVRLGRPLDLQRSTQLDLAALLAEATEGDFAAPPAAPAGSADADAYRGHFDAPALAEALKNIHAGARSLAARDAVPTLKLRREDSTAPEASGAADGATPRAIIEWHGIKATGDNDIFSSFNGGTGLRLALAARIIQAHDGTVEQEPDTLRVRLPLRSDE